MSENNPADSVPQNHPEEQTQQEGGEGWGNWGGWGSWVKETYKSSVENYVKPTLSKVGEKTNKLVADITSAIDVDDEDQQLPAEDRPKEPSDNPTSPDDVKPPVVPEMPEISSVAPTTSDGEGVNPQQEDDEILDKVFEKGKTMLSTGASMLSDFFHKGVETVQHSGVQDIARQGYEKSKQVLASGAKMGIELADKGVHTLEKVGEKALDFIALDESALTAEEDRRAKEKSINAINKTAEKLSAQVSFEAEFGAKNGTRASQALENMSIDCMMKTQQLYRKIDMAKRELVDEQFAALVELFGVENVAGSKTTMPTLGITDEIAAAQQNFVELSQKFKERLKQLNVNFHSAIEDLKVAGHEDIEAEALGLVVSYQHKLRLESVSQLAELSAAAVALVQLVANAFNGARDKKDSPIYKISVTDKATFVHALTNFLSEETTGHSAALIDSMRSLSSSFKTVILDESTQKSIEKEMSQAMNSIYMDAGTAVSNIQEAQKFTMTLCKYLVILTETQMTTVATTPSTATAPQTPESPAK